MQNDYKLAVIIPCWKCANMVNETLDCILAQSFQDWKIFCIDDLSPDGTQSVLKEYSQKDSRIHFVIRNREPKGAQTCRNIGFELSEGAEYVIWFDSDDLIAPYCFEQRVSYMDKHPELDFGVFPAKIFKDKITDNYGWGYGFPIFKDDLKAFLSWALPMVGWTNIYRRSSIIKANHHWDEHIMSMQDSDFNIHSILKGLKYDYAVKDHAQIDYYYRAVGGLSKNIPNHYESHLYLLNKITNNLSDSQKEKYYYELQLYYFNFANIFKKNSKCYKKFLQMPFIKSNKWFHLRLSLWRLSHFHLTYKLFFRDIYKYKSSMMRQWTIEMKRQLDILCP